MRPLNVLMVAACPFPYPRGTPVRIARMAESLTRAGHRVHVSTYHLGQGEVGEGVAVHRSTPVPTYRKLDPGPTYQKLLVVDSLLAWHTRRLARRHRFDLIHAHHYEGLLTALPAARTTRTPLIYDAHTLLSSELPDYRLGLTRPIKRAVGRWMDRHLPPCADYTITVTPNLRERLLALGRLAEDRVSVVENAVEWRHFPQEPWDGAGHPSQCVFAGNLAAYQGTELMLQAYRLMRRERPDVGLKVVIEPGTDTARFRARVAELGVGSALELVEADFAELPRHLADAPVALNPRPICDGIPLKLLNYMAAGKAIVSFTGSSGMLEHGRTGLVVRDDDVEAFAAAALRLLDDESLTRRLGEAARLEVRSHSWDKAAHDLEQVYRNLLEPERPIHDSP